MYRCLHPKLIVIVKPVHTDTIMKIMKKKTCQIFLKFPDGKLKLQLPWPKLQKEYFGIKLQFIIHIVGSVSCNILMNNGLKGQSLKREYQSQCSSDSSH